MSSKHIIGIGQLESGKVVIIHGSAVECDHGLRLVGDCPDCEAEAQAFDDEPGHYTGCICADCSDAELTADND